MHLHNLCSLKRIDNDRPSQPNGASNSSNTGLEIVHLNIGSLKNRAHLSELWLLASEGKTDIITIFETWLNTTVTTLELQIDGYKLYRLDRLHKRGGRVCTYIRRELKATIVKELSYIPERNFYQLWLSIYQKKLKLMVIRITYRPEDYPFSSFDEVLKPNYIQALLLKKPILISGDLNGLIWICSEFKAFTPKWTWYNSLKSQLGSQKNTESLLDVILVKPNTLVRDSGVLHWPISDHSIVFVKLKVKTPKPPPSL